jgi:hypothetical protein
MEYWSAGVLGTGPITPVLQHSSTPFLLCYDVPVVLNIMRELVFFH